MQYLIDIHSAVVNSLGILSENTDLSLYKPNVARLFRQLSCILRIPVVLFFCSEINAFGMKTNTRVCKLLQKTNTQHNHLFLHPLITF